MEGKKIAFIVVSIATVGGIAYYLNKRNKANARVGVANDMPNTPDWTANKPIYIGHESTPINIVNPNNAYDDAARRRNVNTPPTGYFKPTE